MTNRRTSERNGIVTEVKSVHSSARIASALLAAGLCLLSSSMRAGDPPVVNNDWGATNISPTNAWVNGVVTSTAGAPTTVWVYWGTNDGGTDFTQWDNTNEIGIPVQDIVFTTNLVGLVSNTTYTYRTWASNTAGETAWAPARKQFTTGPWMFPFWEPFEERDSGDIQGQYGWVVDTNTAALVQGVTVYGGTKAASASNTMLSHSFQDPAATNQVWIDFYARPARSAGPGTVPSDATAVFYVNTNSKVVAYSGTTANVISGHTITNGKWARFTVRIHYTNSAWSLYYNRRCIVTNFPFYSANVVFTDLRVKEGSTNALSYIDNILITNTSPLFDTDLDGIPDYWEYMFPAILSPDNPSDASADSDGDSVVNLREYIANTVPDDSNSWMRIMSLDQHQTDSVRFTMWTGTNRTYRILYVNSNPDAAMSVTGLVSIVDGAGINYWTNDNAVLQTTNRFYKISVVLTNQDHPTAATALSYTNDRTFGVFVQTRQSNRWYLVGSPVDLGPSNNLGTKFGQQLATGMTAGTDTNNSDLIYYMDINQQRWLHYRYDSGANNWVDWDNGELANLEATPTMGFWIKRTTGGGPLTRTVFVGPVYTNAPAVNIQAGRWNVFSWPYAKAKTQQDLGINTIYDAFGLVQAGAKGGVTAAYGEATGDELWIWEGTSWRQLWLIQGVGDGYDGKWWDENVHDFFNGSLEPGRAYYYLSRGTNFNWTPVTP